MERFQQRLPVGRARQPEMACADRKPVAAIGDRARGGIGVVDSAAGPGDDDAGRQVFQHLPRGLLAMFELAEPILDHHRPVQVWHQPAEVVHLPLRECFVSRAPQEAQPGEQGRIVRKRHHERILDAVRLQHRPVTGRGLQFGGRYDLPAVEWLAGMPEAVVHPRIVTLRRNQRAHRLAADLRGEVFVAGEEGDRAFRAGGIVVDEVGAEGAEVAGPRLEEIAPARRLGRRVVQLADQIGQVAGHRHIATGKPCGDAHCPLLPCLAPLAREYR